MTAIAWVAVAIFVVAYVLIATEWVHRLAAALGGACLMLVLGITDTEHAFFSEVAGIDWNVLFLLLGMMLIVSVLRRTGLFEYLAIWSAKRARGQPFRVMVILVLVTAIASAGLDNVTTVLLVAPVTFLVCDRLGVPVTPFLIAEVMASNIGGAATLVGDPPNIIIASRADLSFNDFLVHMAPFIAIVLVAYIALCRWLFRKAFRFNAERAASVMELRERDAIRDVRLLVVSLVVLSLVLLAFVLHTWLHLEPAVIAIVGGLALLALSTFGRNPRLDPGHRQAGRGRSPRSPSGEASGGDPSYWLDPGDVVRGVEWPTLAFFAGLFVMVGGLVSTGVIDQVATAASDAVEGKLGLATMALLWGSAGLSAIVDNIPYVATMSPIVAELVANAGGNDHAQVLWWALAIGADLGGNATAIGASANVVALGLAERAGKPISFWEFTKYGLVVTAVTITLAVPYLWLRYL